MLADRSADGSQEVKTYWLDGLFSPSVFVRLHPSRVRRLCRDIRASSDMDEDMSLPLRLTSSSVEVIYSPSARTTSRRPTLPSWTAVNHDTQLSGRRRSAFYSPRINSTGAFKSSLEEIWVLHTRSTSILRQSIRLIEVAEIFLRLRLQGFSINVGGDGVLSTSKTLDSHHARYTGHDDREQEERKQSTSCLGSFEFGSSYRQGIFDNPDSYSPPSNQNGIHNHGARPLSIRPQQTLHPHRIRPPTHRQIHRPAPTHSSTNRRSKLQQSDDVDRRRMG